MRKEESSGGQVELVEGRTEYLGTEEALIHVMDHGIIVRGPHPDHPGRLVMVLAGPHSLGTGAACLAATRSPLIQQIKAALPAGVDIADKRRTLWVLVRGEISRRDVLLDLEGVSVLEAGVYERLGKRYSARHANVMELRKKSEEP